MNVGNSLDKLTELICVGFNRFLEVPGTIVKVNQAMLQELDVGFQSLVAGFSIIEQLLELGRLLVGMLESLLVSIRDRSDKLSSCLHAVHGLAVILLGVPAVWVVVTSWTVWRHGRSEGLGPTGAALDLQLMYPCAEEAYYKITANCKFWGFHYFISWRL